MYEINNIIIIIILLNTLAIYLVQLVIPCITRPIIGWDVSGPIVLPLNFAKSDSESYFQSVGVRPNKIKCMFPITC